jgi:hypothetical protein
MLQRLLGQRRFEAQARQFPTQPPPRPLGSDVARNPFGDVRDGMP